LDRLVFLESRVWNVLERGAEAAFEFTTDQPAAFATAAGSQITPAWTTSALLSCTNTGFYRAVSLHAQIRELRDLTI
jgi:hypothetical protein